MCQTRVIAQACQILGYAIIVYNLIKNIPNENPTKIMPVPLDKVHLLYKTDCIKNTLSSRALCLALEQRFFCIRNN